MKIDGINEMEVYGASEMKYIEQMKYMEMNKMK